jgi:protein-tyrosine-phosphatase
MAQVILSSLVVSRRVRAEIASAGLLPGGHPMPPETLHALGALGYGGTGLASFRSRQGTAAEVTRSDLVLGLDRNHVREVVVRMPETWARTFTLKELVRRGDAAGPRGPDEELSEWLSALGEHRDRRELLGSSDADDVADPIGGPPSMFEQTAAEIQGLCVSLVRLLWP